MSITRKIRRALRGEVGLRAALLEACRRVGVALRRRRERAALDVQTKDGASLNARLAQAFARMSDAELLAHFRARATPHFFAGFDAAESEASSESLAGKSGDAVEESGDAVEKSDGLIEEARWIVSAHRWPLLGYGALDFGEEVDWLRDPASGARWPLRFHGDVRLVRGDGSDVRVLWELNRLGHMLTLGRAYALTGDERFAEEFFAQVEGWRAQNPAGFGPNWACAMEVSLRALNLLACFQLLRRSRALDERRLASMLALFDEHGRHVRRNLEFSYIATGNHYLSDVAGLFWLGPMVPVPGEAPRTRAFGPRRLFSAV